MTQCDLSETAAPAPVPMGASKFLYRPATKAIRSHVEQARLDYEPKVGEGLDRNRVCPVKSRRVVVSKGCSKVLDCYCAWSRGCRVRARGDQPQPPSAHVKLNCRVLCL